MEFYSKSNPQRATRHWQAPVLTGVFLLTLAGCDAPPGNASNKADNTGPGIGNRSTVLASADVRSVYQDVGLPDVPTHVNIARGTSNHIDISWNSVVDADAYKVYVAVLSTTGGINWVKHDAKAPSLTLTNVLSTDVLDVLVSVSAVNLAGEGLASTVTSLNDKPPTNLGLQAQSLLDPMIAHAPTDSASNVRLNSQIVVNFTPAPDIKKIFLVLFDSGPVFGTQIDSPGMTQFVPNTLQAGTVYTAKAIIYRTGATGNFNRSEVQWTFTTEIPSVQANATGVPVAVVSTSPKNGDTRVALNKKIRVVFSEPVASSTAAAGITIIGNNGGPLVGAWSARRSDVIFVPASPLSPGVMYSVTIPQGLKSVAGNLVGTAMTISFNTIGGPAQPPNPNPPPTGPIADTTPPTLVSTNPVANELNVAISATPSFTFSEPVDLLSVQRDGGIYMRDPLGLSPVGNWTRNANTMTFTPANALLAGTNYTTFVTPVVKDLAGNAFASNITSNFTTAGTAAPADTTPPNVVGMFPGIGSVDVPVNSTIEIHFSEPILLSSVNNGGIMVGGGSNGLTGSWRGVSRPTANNPNEYVVIFTPSAFMDGGGALYWFKLTGSITDLAGNAFNAAGWNTILFTTAAGPLDTVAPILQGLNPGLGSINVPVNANIEILFSEPMSMSSVINGGIAVAGGPTGIVAGTWTGQPRPTVANPNLYAVVFTPAAPLQAGQTQYIYSFTPDPAAPGFSLVTDLAGNRLSLSGLGMVVFSTVP